MATAALGLKISASGGAQTITAINGVSASVARMQKNMAQAVAVGNMVANGLTRLAGAAKAYFTNTMKQADAIAKGARNAGFAADEYQRLQFASERSGVSFEAVRGAVTKLQVAVATGSDAFRQLGLSQAEMQRLSPEQQFAAVTKELAKVDNQAQRTDIAMQLFGRGAAKDIQVLTNDYAALSVEFDKSGMKISDAALVAGERWSDFWTNVNTKFRATFLNFIPTVKLFLDSLVAGLQMAGGHFVNFFKTVYDVNVAVLKVFGNLAQVLIYDFKDVAFNIGEAFRSAFVNSFENLKRIVTATKEWLLFGGWNVELTGTFDGAQFRELSVGILDPITNAISDSIDRAAAINAEYNAALDVAAKRDSDLRAQTIEARKDTAGQITEQKGRGQAGKSFASAAVLGSAEAATAIAQYRVGVSDIEKEQLAQQRSAAISLAEIATNTRTMAFSEADMETF
jgi:hypothetical protein